MKKQNENSVIRTRADIVHAFTCTDGANVVLFPSKSMVVGHNRNSQFAGEIRERERDTHENEHTQNGTFWSSPAVSWIKCRNTLTLAPTDEEARTYSDQSKRGWAVTSRQAFALRMCYESCLAVRAEKNP